MKKIRFSTIFFALFLMLIVWIDMPENYKVKIHKGPINIDTVLNPPKIDITLGDKKFVREFKTKMGLDLKGGAHLVFLADTKTIKEDERDGALEGARNIIERRVNYFGVSEPEVKTIKSGSDYKISVDLPGVTDVSSAVGLIGQTAKLDFRTLGTDSAKIATDTPVFMLLTNKTQLEGSNIKRSIVEFDPNTGSPVVALEFNSKGSKLFEKLTGENIGKPLGIFLDDVPLTTPTVQQKITGGKAMISGGFTLEDAKKLSIAINSGALPVSIRLVEQRNIGPSLGKAQIEKSVFAGVVGLVSVFLFMILYYGRLGVIASMTLIIYGLVSYALFRIIPIVLTLPGIAGFILSVGMAVDSNILIFERIKEETRRGRDRDLAIRFGFGRAIDAIKDANITTLLVSFILFNPLNWSFLPQFGVVRGFALTLAIGVATSLLTGVVITKRLLLAFYKDKPKKS